MRESKPRITTAHSRELGEELRRARKRAERTGVDVCEELEWSPAKLSKLEQGWRRTSDVEIALLLGRCGTDRATRDRIFRLAAEHDTGYLVRPHDQQVPDTLLCLTIHERAAQSLCKYEPMMIPGLLQTEDYARAMMSSYVTEHDGSIEPFVLARMERQEVLGQRKHTFFVHEAALRGVVGDRRIMRDQLLHVTLMCSWEGITIRIVPFAAGNHLSVQTAHALMTFSATTSPVAYVETDAATLFLDDDAAIGTYLRKQTTLAELALGPDESRSVLARWADTYDR
ncbi:helix-turn-helix domain-containing protein [Umezawaea beigongshangensis]|uniref:helix-turn-helix domain-containing protein n=1 Tax=Umezawaea beigongshangensis TaxID=2780383 RepID=UPI0018F27737|nr:helix-turn-helix transcriptional regulator [Umezawaea beigongshangensis]